MLTFTPEAGDTIVFDGRWASDWLSLPQALKTRPQASTKWQPVLACRLPHAVMPFPQAEGGAQLPRITLVCEHYLLNATELQGVTNHLKLPGIAAAYFHTT